MEVLLDAFRVVTMKPSFEILPLAYAQKEQNKGIIGAQGKNRYTLTVNDERSLRMDIPVDYTNTLANSTDNFQFLNVGYGQFTGAIAYRPKETRYYDF
jgi:hypothetical protein